MVNESTGLGAEDQSGTAEPGVTDDPTTEAEDQSGTAEPGVTDDPTTEAEDQSGAADEPTTEADQAAGAEESEATQPWAILGDETSVTNQPAAEDQIPVVTNHLRLKTARQGEDLACAVCRNSIEAGDGYLEAAYGPVHYIDCANQSIRVS